jgi:hypothetical protein
MVAEFDSMLDRLTSSKPHRHGDKPPPPEAAGIYLFVENGKPVYVGITRNLRARYGQHQRPSSPENSAPFAFAIARRAAGEDGFDTGGRGRVELSKDPGFTQTYFRPAKDRVRAMDFHYLEVPSEDLDSDPKIAVFEVFASIVLETEGDFNSFRTH